MMTSKRENNFLIIPIEVILQQKVGKSVKEFHDIFARHRFDLGTNEEVKVNLTPNDDRPAYGQSLPIPINLKENFTVEVALLNKYGIISTLPFSKYASPIFAQKNLMVDCDC